MPNPTETTSVQSTILSGVETIDSLLYSEKWALDDLQNTYDLSFSFITNESYFPSNNYDADPNSSILWNSNSIIEFSPLQQLALRNVITKWENVSGISLVEVEESKNTVGDIRIGLSSHVDTLVGNATGFAYLPSNFYPSAGDIWFNGSANDLIGGFVESTFENSNFELGSLAYYTALHEVGHSLGLKHPFESLPGSSATLSSSLDEISSTVMSYTYSANDESVLGLNSYPTTPMSLDVNAIQHLYGKNNIFNSGDSTYSFGDSRFYFETISDSGGIDTVIYDGNYGMNLNLIPGSGSFIGKRVETYGNGSTDSEYPIENIWISMNTEIENVIGSRADDIIRGNDLNNEILGGLGNDYILGGLGNDILKGGYGSDVIEGGAGLDTYKVTNLFSEYEITKSSEDTWLINGGTVEGSDFLKGIERINFGDVSFGESPTQVVALDIDAGETAGQAYRLYQAAFDRIPDGPGVAYHVNDIEFNGLSLHQVAQNFLASQEFFDKYGSNLSDADYVNSLYQNVLGRFGADEEVNFYINNFAKEKNDPSYMDRASALIGFSESPENITLVGSQIENGILFF